MSLFSVSETTTIHAPDQPPSACLGNRAPFLQECISELVDVQWLVRQSADTSPEDVPQKVKLETSLGNSFAVGES